MATEEKEKAYEVGAGGKLRKRPFRRTQTTPYDRPPIRNGWLSKVVDPITYSANSLFSLFCKRTSSLETEQKVGNVHPDEAVTVANDSSGKQQGYVDESNGQSNCSDGGGLTELETLLKQKTFTRYEIDRLTALMHSRTVDATIREEEMGTEMVPSESMFPGEQKEEYPKTPALENGIENCLVVAPHFTSSFPIEDVALPGELAKAYMGSRPSKVSSSILDVQTPALREDRAPIKSENFPLESSIMSIMPRATRHATVQENGFAKPRSRSKSAIYCMSRTPYTRIYPTSTLKAGRLAADGQPLSLSQSALDHDIHSGSKQGAVKHRSSVLDNDIGSVGPIRRIREKSNLVYFKGSSLPHLGSCLSVARSGMGIGAAQQSSSSMKKTILLDDVKHSHMKLSEENVDDTVPSLPSKSSAMASKILQQLDKSVSSKEKSSELRLSIMKDNSPRKLSPSMLRGQALRSMEMIDSSKLLDSIQGNKFEGPFGNLSASVQNLKLNSERDKVENGPLKLVSHSNGLPPVITATDATNPKDQVLSNAKAADSCVIKSFSDHPQKKAFHMSAHEDCLDVDDDAYPNGAISSFSPVEKEMTSSPTVLEKTTSGTETVVQENPSALPRSSAIDGEARIRTADESRVGEKVDSSTCITSSILDPIFNPVTEATQKCFGIDKPASPFGSIANPPLFNVENKVLSSTESIATGGPSKEIMKPGLVFALEKVVSSKEPVADAALVNFGSNKNVDKVTPMPFTASSSVDGESTFLKIGAFSDSNLGSSIGSTSVAGATDSMPKVRESDNGESRSSNRASELAVSPAASTSLLTSPKSIFTFGHSSNQNNGSLSSTPPFLSSFSSLASNNFTSQNIFCSSSAATSIGTSATADSTGTSMATTTTSITASSNSSSSTPVFASSSSTSFSKLGPSPVPFGSSVSSPLLGLTGKTAASSGSNLFPSSSHAANTASSGKSLFPSSSPTTDLFNSDTTFGLSASASSSISGTSSTLFGSNWQPSKSPFGSTFSSSTSTGFSFGPSTASVASASSATTFLSTSSASALQFSFTSAAGSTSSQPAFGSPNPVFASAPVNNDQMSMEDSMADDTVQATPPATSILGQQPAPVQSNFVFGASTPSRASPFQFGIQQYIFPQNPSFTASGSLEFNVGGSFSLGTGGRDKSGRRILKVKHKQRKK